MDALNSIYLSNALLHPMCNSKQVCEFHITRDSSDIQNYVLEFYAGTMGFLKIKFSSSNKYLDTVRAIVRALECSGTKRDFQEKIIDKQQDGDEIEIAIDAIGTPLIIAHQVIVNLNVLYIRNDDVYQHLSYTILSVYKKGANIREAVDYMRFDAQFDMLAEELAVAVRESIKPSVTELDTAHYEVDPRVSDTSNMRDWIVNVETEVDEFINQFMIGNQTEQETLRRKFRAGYCYYFAHMLKCAFNRGLVCLAAPLGHFVWVDTDLTYSQFSLDVYDKYLAYDVEGRFDIRESEAYYLIPEEFLGDEVKSFMHTKNAENFESTKENRIRIVRQYCSTTKSEYDSWIENRL